MRTAKRNGTADKGWFRFLSEHCQGSTGFGGDITGMRRLWWGKDAYCVWCCGYWFRVSPQIFETVCGRR